MDREIYQSEFDHATELIAGVSRVEHGATFLKAIERKRDIKRNDLEDNPTIVSDGNLNKDFRYTAGFIAGLNWALDLAREPAKYVRETIQIKED